MGTYRHEQGPGTSLRFSGEWKIEAAALDCCRDSYLDGLAVLTAKFCVFLKAYKGFKAFSFRGFAP